MYARIHTHQPFFLCLCRTSLRVIHNLSITITLPRFDTVSIPQVGNGTLLCPRIATLMTFCTDLFVLYRFVLRDFSRGFLAGRIAWYTRGGWSPFADLRFVLLVFHIHGRKCRIILASCAKLVRVLCMPIALLVCMMHDESKVHLS